MENDLYFTDVFTKTTNGINMEANQLSVNCITSNQNKFHLDSEGNLSVNSITTVQKDTASNEIFDLIYPVNSIYFSMSNVNPSTLFGGTWEEIAKGRTLVGMDESQPEFNVVEKTGGEKTHQLLISEIPEHAHEYKTLKYTGQNLWGVPSYQYQWDTYNEQSAITNYQGSNKEHNNLQPYITCYIWKRIA